MVEDDCTIIEVDGLDVTVPDEWLVAGEEKAKQKVRELRAQYHADRSAVGHEQAVLNHEQRMKP